MMGGSDDKALLTTHFESQLRQLFVSYYYDLIPMEGRRKAETVLKGRVRAAVDVARLLRLLPRAEKWSQGDGKDKRPAGPSFKKPQDAEAKKEARECNMACLRAFVDALGSAAEALWGRYETIENATMRKEFMTME